ncbi:MAG: trimethylamine methyltransferase family protein, partial [Gammaproteobacteria bacterium]
KKLLATYQPPPLDPAVRESIDAYIRRRCEEIGADGG